jgi:O-antigen ligase
MPNLFHGFVFLFFLWNFVSVFWSPDLGDTYQRINTYTQIFLLMLIFWEVFRKPEDLKAGLQAYVFGAYVLIASTIYNYIIGNSAVQFEGRYSATGVNAVDLALILIIGLPIAAQLFFTGSKNKKGTILKLINFVYIPLAIFSIILTGSRTSLIAIIPFGFYLLLTRQIKFGRKIFWFGILFILFLFLIPFIPSSVTERLGTLGSSIETGDLSGRIEYWREALLIFSTHPFIGLGSGTMIWAIGSAVHNTFISVAAETGFIGFALFIIILALAFFQAMNIPNGNSGFWVVIFLSWAIGVSSLSWEFRKLTWLLLNFIVIEGSFTYEQLHIGQVKVEIQKRTKLVFNNNESEIEPEASQ